MGRHLWLSSLCLLVLGSLLVVRGVAGAGVGAPLSQDSFPAAPTAACALQQGSWTIESPDAPKDFAEQGGRTFVLDVDGYPHAVYGGDHLYYAWHDGTVWHRETVDPSWNVGAFSSIALDAAGRPHISYYDRGQADLKYAFFDGSAWQIQTIDANVGSA